ncbi:hypothetical protein QBC40DRAFT_249522 [Triangularia verruculosa]|uniref:Uncharacterized protein n=1 Tax=Triangularia verruculosa TaxID=2587418 RepID=A0AAN6XTC2_9PEZI|nr:hypothetical protein QBC40DRAFT_249522 [Triangularia verruculosa]
MTSCSIACARFSQEIISVYIRVSYKIPNIEAIHAYTNLNNTINKISTKTTTGSTFRLKRSEDWDAFERAIKIIAQRHWDLYINPETRQPLPEEPKKLSALQRYKEELSAYTEYCKQRAAIQALRAQARPNTRNLPEYPEEVYEPIFRFEDLVPKAAQEYERDSRSGGIDRDRYNAVQATLQALARYVTEYVDPEQIDTHC